MLPLFGFLIGPLFLSLFAMLVEVLLGFDILLDRSYRVKQIHVVERVFLQLNLKKITYRYKSEWR